MSDHAATLPANPAAMPSGILIDELDDSIRVQDDLFRHVNGKWIERTEVPSDKARYGSFLVLAEAAEKAVHEIIEEATTAAPGSEERKFGDVYASFMDEKRIERLGARPLHPLLDEVDAIASIDTFLATAGRFERRGTSGFFQIFIDNDPGDPERYLVFLEQGGIGLPDESYYREEKFAEIREKYVAYLQKILGLAGLDRPGRAREAHLRARDRPREEPLGQRALARQRSDLQPREVEGRRRPPLRAGGLNLTAWLDGVDAPKGSFKEVVLRQPSFMESLPSLVTEVRLSAWKDWLAWQVIRSNAAVPELRLRGRQLRFLRQDADRDSRAARALEARCLARRGLAGRSGGTHLRRAALPGLGEEGHGHPGCTTSSRRTANPSPTSSG